MFSPYCTFDRWRFRLRLVGRVKAAIWNGSQHSKEQDMTNSMNNLSTDSNSEQLEEPISFKYLGATLCIDGTIIIVIIIIIINPLRARVVEAPQMISQPVSSIFLCSPLPSGTWQTPDLSIVVFPPLLLSAFVFFPLSLCLARWFLPDLMNGRHVHATAVCVSLCGPIACRILAWTSSLVTWSLCEMHSILHLFPWLVFFGALLWGSMIHKHTGRWMAPGQQKSALGLPHQWQQWLDKTGSVEATPWALQARSSCTSLLTLLFSFWLQDLDIACCLWLVWGKQSGFLDQVPEETSLYLLLGAQDQWPGEKQISFIVGSQKPLTVWFGHVTYHNNLSNTKFQGTLEGRQQCEWQRKCWMNNIKEWTSLSIPELLTMASGQTKTKKEGKRSLLSWLSCPPDNPARPVSLWTELNWN